MKTVKSLDLSIDVGDIDRESVLVIRAMFDIMPTLDGQRALLDVMQAELKIIDSALKGVEQGDNK
ncbi:hypothetical protein J2T12_005118 [Paenibacillus anaericanus]|uniref:hypothetical protein n=1 Tax=Paenibacillus anaericanus TaxID=170367 RepID=UPI002786EDC2|nr:hypothetical protein [Paenibacillus anaericanus]MDQ0091678.1 hypothetical protein [Paenibacillus anaericanus]